VPNPENVRPHQFKPGQSGNPAGYSRSRRITDALIRLIAEENADDALAKLWLKKAMEADPRFFAMLLERVEGKVKQTLEIEQAEIKSYDVANTPDDL